MDLNSTSLQETKLSGKCQQDSMSVDLAGAGCWDVSISLIMIIISPKFVKLTDCNELKSLM